VRDGLKVVVFEQPAKVLQERLGSRVAGYGLREVFPRVPDHPALEGVNAHHLRDPRRTDRFARPGERGWLDGLYLDVPEEWDDPYRFFRW
jgi:hypothetical protein